MIAPPNTPFDKQLIPVIIRDLRKQLPREGCGIVVNNKYIPCTNTSESDNSFVIDIKDYAEYLINGELQCVVHSHNNSHNASERDVQQQMALGVPYGIFNYIDKKIDDIVFWGDTVTPLPLIGRSFWYGVLDCFSICRDYWRLEGFNMPNFIRGGNWDTRKINDLVVNNLKETGWYIIDLKDIEPGDALLFQTKAGRIAHMAIYAGSSYMIEHMNVKNALSIRDLVGPWMDRIKYVVRFNKETLSAPKEKTC